MKTYQKTWSADSRVNVVQAFRHVGPETFEELRDLVRQASKDGHHVRAHGAGHSYSDVTQTSRSDGILIEMRNLNQVLKLNAAMLKPDAELRTILHLDNTTTADHPLKKQTAFEYLVSVEAGMNILELNQALAKRDLAAPQLGSYNMQAVVGAMATSTHGSGITLGPLHDMIRSLTLVSTDGQCYRIEPRNGISDPAKFRDPGMILKQDDDWFYSAVVSMGTMGVIYSVILEVQDSYWLEQNRTYFADWPDARQEIVSKSLLERTRHVEVFLNPNAVGGKHACVLTRRRVTGEKTPRGGRPSSPLLQIIKCMELSQNANKEAFGKLSPLIPPAIRLLLRNLEAAAGAENSKDSDDISEDDRSVLATLANLTKLWIPAMSEGLRGIVGTTYVDRSYEVLFLGANSADAIGIEAGFEYTTMAKADELLSFIFQFFAAKNTAGHASTTPMGMRFVKGTKAYLSPQYGRDTVMFEVGMVAGTRNGIEMLEELQDKLQKKGGRLHWGLHLAKLDVSPATLRAQYPRYGQWVDVYRKLNSKGTFNNSFTDRLGISVARPGSVGVSR